MSSPTTESNYELRLKELEASIQNRFNRSSFPLMALVFATLVGFFALYQTCVNSMERRVNEQVTPLKEEVKRLSARIELLPEN